MIRLAFVFILVMCLQNVHTVADLDVRFASNGPNTNSDKIGSVEVLYNGMWLPICQNQADYSREADVICREMGYVSGWQQLYTVNGSTAFLEINCRIGDMMLSACGVTHYTHMTKECIKDIIVGVRCFNDTGVRLLGGTQDKPNIGRVQVQYEDIWSDVCYHGTGIDRVWNNLNVKVLCRQLGYPASLLTLIKTSTIPYSDVFTDDYKCNGDELRLHACLPDLPSNVVCPRNEYVLASCAGPGYLGCFRDAITDVVDPLLPDYPNKANNQPWWMDDNMTIDKCLDSCRKLQNMSFAGLQAGNLCFCGTARRQLDFRIYLADDQSQCNDPCTGNEYEICGGQRRTAIYDILLGICNSPDVPENGQIIMDNSLENGTIPFGAVVAFACNPGFGLIGSPSIQCVLGNMPNESVWNTSIPICQKIPRTSTRALATTMPLTLITALPVTNTTNIGVIVGALGGAFMVILIILCTIYCIRSKKQSSVKTSSATENNSNFANQLYADVPDGLVQLSTITGNNKNASDTREKPPISSSLPTYAVVQKDKPSSDLHEYAAVTMETSTPSGYNVNSSETKLDKLQQPPSSQPVYDDVAGNESNLTETQRSSALPTYAVVKKEQPSSVLYDYADITTGEIPAGNNTSGHRITSNGTQNTSSDPHTVVAAAGSKTSAPSTDVPPSSSSSLPPYAVVRKGQLTDRKQSEHDYADIEHISNNVAGNATETLGSGSNEGEQEGWSENILYGATAIKGDLPKTIQKRGDSRSEIEGWEENTIYDKCE